MQNTPQNAFVRSDLSKKINRIIDKMKKKIEKKCKKVAFFQKSVPESPLPKYFP